MANSVVTDDEGLTRLVGWYESAEELTRDARQDAETCRDYVDGKQWTDAEVAEKKKRKQPVITINRMKRKIDFLKGVEKKGRTDPKALPRNPNDEQRAQAATDALRYVCDDTDFDMVRSEAWDNLLVEGVCAAELVVTQGRDKPQIRVNILPFDRIFFDPHSRFADFRDAKYLGVVVWMDLEDAQAVYGEKKELLTTCINDHNMTDTHDDRPRVAWADSKRKRVKVAQICYREAGVWMRATFCRAGYLRAPEQSWLLDEDGKPDCPMVFQSAYVDRENNRYGMAKEMISPQDEINHRRSKMLHLLNVRQTVSERGAFAGFDDTTNDLKGVALAKRELAKPDGHIQVNPGKRFEVLPTGDMARGQFELLQEAKSEMDLLGPNAAMEGKHGGDPSGRAIQLQQQGGYIELEPLLDALRFWTRRIYRKSWGCIRQFWTNEVWVRVTDSDEKLKWVGMNVPVTMRDQLQAEGVQIPPEAMADPRLDMVVSTHNPIVELDVDIMIDEGPDLATLQSEQFETVMNAVNASGQPLPLPLLLKLIPNLKDREKLIKEIEEGGSPAMAQMGQQMQALQQENQAIKQDQQIKLRELEVKDYDSKTKRINVAADAVTNAMSFDRGHEMAPMMGAM
jgi:hypothetical protein